MITKKPPRLLKEIETEDHIDVSEEDVRKFAEHLGIRLPVEEELLWIAKCGLEASVPPPWNPVEDPQGRIYYYNNITTESSWEHPLDAYYKMLVKQERFRLVTNQQRMRLPSDDSGTSGMSSLDDIPRDSLRLTGNGRRNGGATSGLVMQNSSSNNNNGCGDERSDYIYDEEDEETQRNEEGVRHMSLKRSAMMMTSSFRSTNQRSRYNQRSRSCPSLAERGHDKDGTVLWRSNDDLLDDLRDDSEDLATIKQEAIALRALTVQRKHLLAELNRLKMDVRKYQFIRERLKFSPPSATFTIKKRDSAAQTDILGVNLNNNNNNNGLLSTIQQQLNGTATTPTSNEQQHSFAAEKPPHYATLPKPTNGQHRIGHEELAKIAERVQAIRQRHSELTIKCVSQVEEQSAASSAVVVGARTENRTSIANRRLLSQLALATKGGISLTHSATPPLSIAPPSTQQLAGAAEHFSYGIVAPPKEYRTDPVAPPPTPLTPSAEWLRRISELRCSVNQCRLRQPQLTIK